MSTSQSALSSILWACISSWYYGYHLSELNFPVASLTCLPPAFPPPSRLPLCLGLDANTYGFVTATFAAGGLTGSLASSWLVHHEGIKGGILWTGYLNLIGVVLMAMAPHWYVLALGRYIVGTSAGISVCLVSPFLAIIARSSPELATRSGQIGCFNQMGIVIGLFSAQAAGLILTGWKGDIPGRWRYVVALSGIFSIVQILVAPAIGEPVGQLGKAAPASDTVGLGLGLRTISEADEPENPLLESIAPDVSPEQQLHLREVLSNTSLRSPTILAAAIMILQELSGVNAVMFYSTPVLRPLMPTAAATIGLQITGINIVMTILALFMIDRAGRKPLLLASVAGMAVMSSLLAYSLDHDRDMLSAASIILFIVSFSIGLGPVPWLLLSELVPPPAVPAVASLALSMSWITNFVVAALFLPLRDAMSSPSDPRDPLSDRIGEGRVFYTFTVVAIVTFSLVWRALHVR